MALTNNQQTRAWVSLVKASTGPGKPIKWNKPLLRATVDAVETWVQANKISFVSALPAGFASKSTADEKILVLEFVLEAIRHG